MLRPAWHFALLVLWVAVLGFFFAMVEIQIEGPAGWAASLPTWRIESHWLLDIFWGGRPMTGYHAWVFSFMALVFHLPVFINGVWSNAKAHGVPHDAVKRALREDYQTDDLAKLTAAQARALIATMPTLRAVPA